MPQVPTLTLPHGAAIPQLGFGTWPMNDREVEAALLQALEIGYRHVDTAYNYRNERGVGAAIAASGLAREEIFVTTKFNAEWHDKVDEAWQMAVDKLGVDYIDMFMAHWPNPRNDRYVKAVEGLKQLLRDGKIKAIGVSNFKPAHLDRVITESGITPDVNQIELDPSVSRPGPRAYAAEHGIVTEAWSPLGAGSALLGNDAIKRIAGEHGRSPAQVVLRWHMQLGLVAIPKSSNPERMRQNIDIFDFELGEDEMAALSALDRGESAASDSDSFGH